jgi:hypothetical protein
VLLRFPGFNVNKLISEPKESAKEKSVFAFNGKKRFERDPSELFWLEAFCLK